MGRGEIKLENVSGGVSIAILNVSPLERSRVKTAWHIQNYI